MKDCFSFGISATVLEKWVQSSWGFLKEEVAAALEAGTLELETPAAAGGIDRSVKPLPPQTIDDEEKEIKRENASQFAVDT